MHKAKISGTGPYLPQKKIFNIDLFKKTNNFDLGKANYSLERKGLDVSQIDAVLFTSIPFTL